MSFERKDPCDSIRRRGVAAAVCQFATELADLFGYWIGLFALVGAWSVRKYVNRPIDRFARLYLALYSLIAVVFTVREGYIEARHLLPWVVIGIACAGWGALVMGGWLGHQVSRVSAAREGAASRTGWLAVAAAGAACLVDLAWPLNDSELGHRQAAQWLAVDADAPGIVLDTHGWTGLYSGRPTHRYKDARQVFASADLAYVVVDQRELGYSSGRARTLKTLLDVAGSKVGNFPTAEDRRADRRTVLVYRWHPERFSRWANARCLPGGGRDPQDLAALARPGCESTESHWR
jgi:hypothetical protein